MKKTLFLIIVIFYICFPGNLYSWEMSISTSPIDDSQNIIIRLKAENAIQGWLQQSTPTLILRCQENKTDAYIVTDMTANIEYGENGATILIRFDKEKAKEYVFDRSTDNNALFSKAPVALINEILKHKIMLFQFTPFNASPTMTTFKIDGLDKVIDKLKSACHWK